MGPTGDATDIHADETVPLAGGGLGNAVLFSIGAALRAAGSRVLYFAGYKAMSDRYKVDEIERAADVIIWCCDEAPGLHARAAPQDRSLRRQHRAGDGGLRRAASWARQPIPLNEADRIDRHRLGPHDAGGRRGAPRRAGALPEAGPHRDRLDQLADAMHDEGSLRPVPAAADRSGDRRAHGGVLLLQPGPGAGPRGFPGAERAAAAEQRCRRN